MGQVTITLNGRTYRLRCGDGEEQRLLVLSDHVRGKIDQLAAEVGQVGDDRLMVMAALLVADELFEARTQLAEAATPDPSLFEPLPEIVQSDAPTTAARRAAEPIVPAPDALGTSPPTVAPAPGRSAQATVPSPQAQLEPKDPTNSSLKRALRRPQAKQSLEERLAEARDNPSPDRSPSDRPPSERPPSERKTGSG